MRAPHPDLRELDRRVVPRAAVALRRRLDTVTAWRAGVGGSARRAAADGWAALDRLDARMTARGPLAVARQLPVLALLVVAVVGLAATAAAVTLSGADEPSSAAPTVRVLGVPAGADADVVLAAAEQQLDEVAGERPGGQHVALVSLSRYLTPAALEQLLAGMSVQRVYLRAPAAGEAAEVVEVPLTGDVAAVLTAVCERTAQRRTEDAAQLTRLAETMTGTTEQELEARAMYEAAAAHADVEARAFGGECATAYAAVVEATARDLAGLSGPDVRGVQAAPLGTELADVEVVPPLPATPDPTTTAAGT